MKVRLVALSGGKEGSEPTSAVKVALLAQTQFEIDSEFGSPTGSQDSSRSQVCAEEEECEVLTNPAAVVAHSEPATQQHSRRPSTAINPVEIPPLAPVTLSYNNKDVIGTAPVPSSPSRQVPSSSSYGQRLRRGRPPYPFPTLRALLIRARGPTTAYLVQPIPLFDLSCSLSILALSSQKSQSRTNGNRTPEVMATISHSGCTRARSSLHYAFLIRPV